MESTYFFAPPRRGGYIVFGTLLFLSSAGFAWQVLQSASGVLAVQLSRRLPWMLLFTAVFVLAVYAFRALQGAYYLLMRDGIVLHWGLREVTITAYDILWMAPAETLEAPLPKPWLRLPGAWLGSGQFTDPSLGKVEYLASGGQGLVVIATPSGAFVVSPDNAAHFLQAFAALNELGSVAPLPSRDIRPGDWLGESWQQPGVRFLWLGSLALVLAVWSLALWGMAHFPRLSLGFTAWGAPRSPVPSGSLVLLPVLYTFFLALDWLSGQFFYRRQEEHLLSYVLWSAALLSGLGFLWAVVLIVRQGG